MCYFVAFFNYLHFVSYLYSKCFHMSLISVCCEYILGAFSQEKPNTAMCGVYNKAYCKAVE